MHLWTKAAILLIVTNSMASSGQSNGLQKAINLRVGEFNCSVDIALSILRPMEQCLVDKWAFSLSEPPTPDPEWTKRECCYNVDDACVRDIYVRKNCKLLSGYEEYVQNEKKKAKEVCTKYGVNPDKDCTALKKSVSSSCDKFVCPQSSAHKVMTQTLALFVVSILTIFVFY